MKEHPILFTGEMVRAVLDERKTQTRRVVKPQPELRDGQFWYWSHPRYDNGTGTHYFHTQYITPSLRDGMLKVCPYGYPGDRLWVRETWQPCRHGDTGEIIAVYRSDWESNGNPQGPIGGKWRPSIHMPRWASRITLEVMDIRVQKVQEISEEDAEAEGAPYLRWKTEDEYPCYRAGFYELWNSINAKRGYSWESNPFVQAITFKKL